MKLLMDDNWLDISITITHVFNRIIVLPKSRNTMSNFQIPINPSKRVLSVFNWGQSGISYAIISVSTSRISHDCPRSCAVVKTLTEDAFLRQNLSRIIEFQEKTFLEMFR